MNQNEKNRLVFEDTERRCKQYAVLKKAIKTASEHQKVYKENDVVTSSTEPVNNGKKTNIVVSKKRSFEAAAAYKGKQICVHNFASATNPGGGVVHGSTAQEECLCRTSTLYFNLNSPQCWNEFYTPHRAMNNAVYNNDCIYTPGVIVFKDDSANPEVLPEKEWYSVDVITCAAPNLREKPSNRMNPNAGNKKVTITRQELLEIHVKRGERILEIATAHKNDVIILGAFGCGAFQNPPEVVAEAYCKLLEEFDGDFEIIEFAVYCSPKDTANFDVFQKKIKAYMQKRK